MAPRTGTVRNLLAGTWVTAQLQTGSAVMSTPGGEKTHKTPSQQLPQPLAQLPKRLLISTCADWILPSFQWLLAVVIDGPGFPLHGLEKP